MYNLNNIQIASLRISKHHRQVASFAQMLFVDEWQESVRCDLLEVS
jgi:hypothetical protein